MAKAVNILDHTIQVSYLKHLVTVGPGDVFVAPEYVINQHNAGHLGRPKPFEVIEPDPPELSPVISREDWARMQLERAVISREDFERSSERKTRGRKPKSLEAVIEIAEPEMVADGAE